MRKNPRECNIFLTRRFREFLSNTFFFKFIEKNIFYFKLTSDPKAKRFYYKLLCLPLLPAKSIRMAFQQLKLQMEIYQEEKGFSGAFDRFLYYYENQWINGTRHVSAVLSSLFLIILAKKQLKVFDA